MRSPAAPLVSPRRVLTRRAAVEIPGPLLPLPGLPISRSVPERRGPGGRAPRTAVLVAAVVRGRGGVWRHLLGTTATGTAVRRLPLRPRELAGRPPVRRGCGT